MKTRLIFILPLLLLSTTVMSQNVTDAGGKKQGPWVKKYPNGNIMYQGTFRDDKPVGLFKRYTEEVCFFRN